MAYRLERSKRESIIEHIDAHGNGDALKKWNECELMAAFYVLNGRLGKEFCDREVDPLLSDLRPGEHPIADYLNTGLPLNLARVIHLSHIVEDIHNFPNFASKRKELRGRRYDGVYFELKMAQYFRNENLPISFIPPQKGQKQCEFILCNNVYVECKRRSRADLGLASLESSFYNYIESTILKTPNQSISILLIELPLKHDATVKEWKMIEKALYLSVEAIAEAYPAQNECVAAIQILSEIEKEDKRSETSGLLTEKNILWPGAAYHELPRGLLNVLENRRYPSIPYVPWVDYGGLTNRL
jgi:hypothetical protein